MPVVIKQEVQPAPVSEDEEDQDYSDVALQDNKYQKFTPSAHYNPAIHDSKKRKYDEISSAYHSNIGIKPSNNGPPHKKRRH